MACRFDIDCPGAAACYSNTTWYAPILQVGGDGCLCSTWYGFSGPTCEESDTPAAKFWVGSAVFLVVMCGICSMISLKNALRLYKTANVKLVDTTSISNIQVFFSFLFSGVSQIFTAIEPLHPDLVTKPGKPTGDKIATTKVTRETLMVLGVCSVIVAAMSIALVWVEVAERARRMAHRSVATLIPNTRKAVVVFEASVVIAMIAACAALLPSVAVVIGIIAIFVVIGIYLMGFCKIYMELKSVSSIAAESTKVSYKAVIREIERTLVGTVLCALILLGICIAILVLSLDDWRESSQPGSIPGIIVAWQLLSLAILTLGTNLLVALWRATSRKINHSKSSDQPSASGNAPNATVKLLEGASPIKTDGETKHYQITSAPSAISNVGV